jgi:hypothetical protein
VLGCSARTAGTHVRRAQAKADRAFARPKPSVERSQAQTRRNTA